MNIKHRIYICYLISAIHNLLADAGQTIAVTGAGVTLAATTTSSDNPLEKKDTTSTSTTSTAPAVSGTPAAPANPLSSTTPALWTIAIHAFGGSAGIFAKTASKTMPASITSSSLGYNEAQVIVQYLNSSPMNAIDSTNINTALAQNPASPANPTAVTSNNTPADWTAAITAFGGAAGISAKTASKTMPTSMTPTSAGYNNALVIFEFLNEIPMNPADSANLTTALAANQTSTTPAAAPTTTPTPAAAPAASGTTPPVPQVNTKKQQILISVYLQNNYEQDAMLNKMEILLANQTTPLVKSNLNIPVKAAKNIYSKGSITAFDITTESTSIQSFNGIQSITVGDDQITFADIKTGTSLSHPIAITKKDGHWVADTQL